MVPSFIAIASSQNPDLTHAYTISCRGQSDEDQVERAPKVEECKLKSCKDFNELLEQREEKVMAERQVLTDSIVKISKELAALEERATEVERTNAVLEERSNAMHEEIRQTKEEFERMEKAQVTAKHQNIEMGHNIMTLELELQKQHFEARQAQAAMIKALWCVVKCGLPQRSIQHHKHCQFETGMELELALTLSCSQAHPQAGTLPRKVSAQRLFILNPDPNTPCIFYSRYKKGSHQAARAHDLPALTPVTPLVTSSSFDARLAARRRKSLRSRNATVNHFVIPYARVKRMVLLRTVTKKVGFIF